MGEVVDLDVLTTLDIPAEKVLTGALQLGLAQAVVIGFDEEGNLYFASSQGSNAETLYLMELAKRELLEPGPQGPFSLRA